MVEVRIATSLGKLLGMYYYIQVWLTSYISSYTYKMIDKGIVMKQ